MKVRNAQRIGRDEVELQMTPMIDIVFQLLIFFVMTFKIVVQEGDFNIKMPRDGPDDGPPPESVTFDVTLKADAAGRLAAIETSRGTIAVDPARRGRILEGFGQLRQQVIEFVGEKGGPGSIRDQGEAKIQADEHLHYIYVIDAVTHVSGVPADGGVSKLLKNISFVPPKKR